MVCRSAWPRNSWTVRTSAPVRGWMPGGRSSRWTRRGKSSRSSAAADAPRGTLNAAAVSASEQKGRCLAASSPCPFLPPATAPPPPFSRAATVSDHRSQEWEVLATPHVPRRSYARQHRPLLLVLSRLFGETSLLGKSVGISARPTSALRLGRRVLAHDLAASLVPATNL